ncbi:DNA gyrase subunit A [archaeon RBG_16_50_20]|nr:MAG: DNA gyrase subunit A [archaeon RBG_16_50_20]
MRKSYIKYAMSVIVGRALPDVRDGLKPVQRRILYAIQGLGLGSKTQHKKSARVAGEVIGKYHPHGEMAVYDALVRMAQDFSMRYPLIDGQGNFGSIDGDEPAAMRYTEARLAKLAEEMLVELDKDTVNWMPNYDDSLQEPAVLPARFPNLLVNGASGIAVGMSCSIPPHNLREVIDALVYLVDHPNAQVEDLLNYIKGPDFPTGGIIYDATSLLQIYKQGRGSVRILARLEEEVLKGDRKRLVITEVPFQVNKSKLVEDIANLVREDRLEGISNIRDESSREGMRVTLDLKAGFPTEVVKGQLYKQTQLHTSFSFINLVLLDGRPQILDLKQTLQAFIDHRVIVIERRSKHDLQKAQERLNVLDGYSTALKNIDRVITTIRSSEGPQEAAAKLKELNLNDAQIDAILQMRLQQLTRLEAGKIEKESNEKRQEIQRLQLVLGERAKLLEVLKSELVEIKESYGDDRRTEVRLESVNFDVERVIQDEQVLVFISVEGYVKRVPAKSFTVLGRGAKGILSMDVKEKDKVLKALVTRTLHTVMFLTNQGRAYTMKAHEIPEAGRSARGTPLVNLLQLSEGERVMGAIAVDDFPSTKFLTLVTKQGTVKRTPLDAFSNVRSSGIIATQFDENDTLAEALITTGDGEVVIATSEGLAIRFNESDISVMGRTAKGVVGIRLDEGSEVVGACFIPSKAKDFATFMITKKGYGKKTLKEKYRLQKRGGYGVIALKVNSKTGNLVGILGATKDCEVLTVSEKGQAVRLSVDSIANQGRASSGVRIARLDEGDRISSVALIPAEANAS